MNNLINRQEAINFLKAWADGSAYIEIDTKSAIKAFEQLSTVDAVPVIRCEYCRYLDYDKPAGVYCCTKAFGHQVSPSFYCDFAKERDNEVERIQTTAI